MCELLTKFGYKVYCMLPTSIFHAEVMLFRRQCGVLGRRGKCILWLPCGPGAIGTLRKSFSKSTSWSIVSLVPSRPLVLEKKPKKNEVFVVAVPSIGGHSQDPPIRRPGECGKNPPRTKLLFALSSTVLRLQGLPTVFMPFASCTKVQIVLCDTDYMHSHYIPCLGTGGAGWLSVQSSSLCPL